MIFTSCGSDWSWIWVAAWMMASRTPTTAAAIIGGAAISMPAWNAV